MLRNLILLASVVGGYALLRGWVDGPSLILRCCFAVAAVVFGLVVFGGRTDEGKARMTSLRGVVWLDYLTLGIAVLFTEACFVALTSLMVAPSQYGASEVHDYTFDLVGLEHDSNDQGDGSLIDFNKEQNGHWLFKPNLERQLPKKSNHKPSNKPEVFMQLSNAEDAQALLNSRIHLRAFALSRFDGIAWTASPTPKVPLEAPIRFTVKGRQKQMSYEVFQAVNPTGQNLFTAMNGAGSTDLLKLTQVAESIYMLPSIDEDSNGYSYKAESSPLRLTDLIGEAIAPAQTEAEMLMLPLGIEKRLQKTVRNFELEPDLFRKLVALRSFLQDNYQYSLITDNQSDDSPLVNFLYHDRRGYCEHFATAAAMLSRALGVPSRVAYGWSGGRLYQAQNMFVFRAKDAHAWTEIKLEGYGWVVFDTTPPDDDAIPEAHVASENEAAPNPMELFSDLSDERGWDESAKRFEINPQPLLIGLAVIAIGVAGFVLLRNRYQPVMGPNGKHLNSPPAAYFQCFKDACAVLGAPMATGITLRQQVALLKERGLQADIFVDMLEYHYGVIYSNWPEDKNRERAFVRSIREWRKQWQTEQKKAEPGKLN